MSKSFRYRQNIPSNQQHGRVLFFRAMQANSYNKIYKLGDFRVDPMRRKLVNAEGEVVYLTPKTFDLLLMLIESGGRIVTKDELMSTVWNDAFVEEANLVQTISMLRKALGETRGDNRFIVTVPGRGYRFITQVEEIFDNDFQEKSAVRQAAALTLVEAKDSKTSSAEDALIEKETEDEHTTELRKWIIPAAVFLGVALVCVLAWTFFAKSTEPKNPQEIKSIAVLPFKT